MGGHSRPAVDEQLVQKRLATVVQKPAATLVLLPAIGVVMTVMSGATVLVTLHGTAGLCVHSRLRAVAAVNWPNRRLVESAIGRISD